MADDKFPFGREINYVGTENNENYFSDVSLDRKSFNNNSSNNTSGANEAQIDNIPDASSSVQTDLSSTGSHLGVEPIDVTVAADTSTAISTASSGSTATTATTVAGTTTVAGATVVAVSIGVISTAAAAVASIVFQHFDYQSRMEDRSIAYTLEVEVNKSALVYTHLLDEQNNEVARQEFEITLIEYEQLSLEKAIDEPVMDSKIQEIYGEFTDLEYKSKYTFEAFYEEDGKTNIIYKEEGLFVEYVPCYIENVQTKINSNEQTIFVSFDLSYFELDKEIVVSFLEEGNEVYKESFLTEEVEQGAGETYISNHYEVTANNMLPGHTYDLNITFDNDNIYSKTGLSVPEIEQTAFLEEVSYESDMFNRNIVIFAAIRLEEDKNLFFELTDENGELVEKQEHALKLEECEETDIGYINYFSTEFNDLHYHIQYHLDVYYIEGSIKVPLGNLDNIEVTYEANVIEDLNVTTYEAYKAVMVSFSMTFDEFDREAFITINDENNEVIASETIAGEIPPENPDPNDSAPIAEDLGEGLYRDNFDVSFSDLEINASYYVYIYKKDASGELLSSTYFEMPDVPQTVFYREDSFSYTSDTLNSTIELNYAITYSEDTYIQTGLYDEEGQLVESNSYYLTVPSPLLGAASDENIFRISESYSDLLNKSIYTYKATYTVGVIEFNIFEQEVQIDYQPYNVIDISYEKDTQRKAARVTADITFDEEEKEITLFIYNEKKALIGTATCFTVIDSENPGYKDYGQGIYAMRYTFDPFVCLDVGVYSLSFEADSRTFFDTTFEMENAEEVIPYVELLNYQSDYENKTVTLSYLYTSNGVTYSSYVMEITNLSASQSYSVEVEIPEMSSSIVIEMEEYGLSIGHSYRFNLCGVDEQGKRVMLAQNAIYY